MRKFISRFLLLVLALTIVSSGISAEKKQKSVLNDTTFAGLKFRAIGPALMSGRIADIAIHPEDNNTWYVAVGSGGVWKTENAATTWKPIFDDQPSYSTGCVTIDPGNPHVIWVGTGENIGGRHVGYGDGIYRSQDGGASWKNMGLKKSEHISKIIIHPENPDIIWVAAQGPLWAKGGERGLYKSKDGGNSWNKVLGDDEWIGVTDLVIDPDNSKWLYAATWQRHRNVAAFMGGGPGSGLHRSKDGGDTWEKLSSGLPGGNMGKIGLAISPQNPDVLYAAIELDLKKGGLYRSENRGASWEKMSDAVANPNATGPHYYQELVASPHQFDLIYLLDVRVQVSKDGGKTFKIMQEKHKHSDNHAMVFRQDDPDYILMGTDGGLYESFDLAKNWRFIPNLPLTQYYKVALDDTEPFYNIYGGTQDNNTQGGPSRTDNYHGIRNSDWFITMWGDGHQPATEPGNPDIMYSEWQQGNLMRVDRTTGEFVYIKPQPEAGEDFERYNWDAPILISPHSPTRLYFASQRVWRSEDRGDTWTAISADLTRDQERITLPIMGKTQSWDSPWDVGAMSNYNTITSLAESPKQAGLIYAGTDDGIIQVTENGGQAWAKIEVGNLPGVPKTAFVNDIKADLYDANTAYIALDNHKFGDLNPYLFKTTNHGKSWKSIKGNLPDRTLVWRLVQDHVKPELLFAATEFGIYFTIDGGGNWVKLKGNVPTISFRDLAIQRRENDLVGASFGRGFFVFDDYSVLRDVTEAQLKREATLFSTRKAWWYIKRPVLSFDTKASQGAGFFSAPNPPFGAVFTYYLADDIKTKKQVRRKNEKELTKKKANMPFPGWDALETERRQEEPTMQLTVKDMAGNVIRRVEGPAKKGFHRVAWDLRLPATDAIDIGEDFEKAKPVGAMAAPGDYTVMLSKRVNGVTTDLSEPMPFKVERLHKGALKSTDPIQTAAFWQELATLDKSMTAAKKALANTMKKVSAMQVALSRTQTGSGTLDKTIHDLNQALLNIEEQMGGNKSKRQIGERNNPTAQARLDHATLGTWNSTYGPTPAHKRSLELARKQFGELKTKLQNILTSDLPKAEKALVDAGAPWITGQDIP